MSRTKVRSARQNNLLIFAAISIATGVMGGIKFEKILQLPMTLLVALVTFFLCVFFENIILRFMTSIEQRARLRKIFETTEDVKPKGKRGHKEMLKALKGEEAVNYAQNKYPAWMRHFIPGGYAGEHLLRAKLAAAGILNYPIQKYVAFKIAGVIGLGFFGFKMFPSWIGMSESPNLLIVQVASVAVGAFAGFFIVDRWITEKSRERSNKVAMALPDAVDILTIYVSAGVLFDVALIESHDTLKKINKEVAFEFRKLAEDMSISQDRALALDKFMNRCDSPSVREFVSIVKQAIADGAPMSDSFKKLSLVLRKERILLVEKKAARIPVLLILPQISLMLPCIIVLLMYSTASDIVAMLTAMAGF